MKPTFWKINKYLSFQINTYSSFELIFIQFLHGSKGSVLGGTKCFYSKLAILQFFGSNGLSYGRKTVT